jgi:hypothetical protein
MTMAINNEDVMDKKPPKVEVGEDSVVMGQVTGSVGHRSVVRCPSQYGWGFFVAPQE